MNTSQTLLLLQFHSVGQVCGMLDKVLDDPHVRALMYCKHGWISCWIDPDVWLSSPVTGLQSARNDIVMSACLSGSLWVQICVGPLTRVVEIKLLAKLTATSTTENERQSTQVSNCSQLGYKSAWSNTPRHYRSVHLLLLEMHTKCTFMCLAHTLHSTFKPPYLTLVCGKGL